MGTPAPSAVLIYPDYATHCWANLPAHPYCLWSLRVQGSLLPQYADMLPHILGQATALRRLVMLLDYAVLAFPSVGWVSVRERGLDHWEQIWESSAQMLAVAALFATDPCVRLLVVLQTFPTRLYRVMALPF